MAGLLLPLCPDFLFTQWYCILFAVVQLLSHVQFSVTPWTAARQTPLLSILKSVRRFPLDCKLHGSWSLSCREVTQSCPTLCDPMDYSPPVFSVHGVFQARVPEWVAFSFFTVQLSHPHITTGKFTALTIWTFVSKVMSLFWPHFSKTVLCHQKFFTPLTDPSLVAIFTDTAF